MPFRKLVGSYKDYNLSTHVIEDGYLAVDVATGSLRIGDGVTAGGTEIMNTDYNMYIQALSSEQLFNSYNTYLYHPNSTSSIEYKLQFSTTSNTDVVRMNQNGTKYTTIILLEIEG